jgi:hypothetical protein
LAQDGSGWVVSPSPPNSLAAMRQAVLITINIKLPSSGKWSHRSTNILEEAWGCKNMAC